MTKIAENPINERLRYLMGEWPIASIGVIAFILSIPAGLLSMGLEMTAKATAVNIIATAICAVLAYSLVMIFPVVYHVIRLDFFVGLLYIFIITYAYFTTTSFLFGAISMPAMADQISFFAFLSICVSFTFSFEVLFGGMESKMKVMENNNRACGVSA